MQPHSAFVLRVDSETGQSIEFPSWSVHPFVYAEIRALETSHSDPIDIVVQGDDAVVDGNVQLGHAKFTAQIEINKKTNIYALVHGGWLPMPLASPPRFLVDRNVIIPLRRMREGGAVDSPEMLEWWASLLLHESTILNPLPYAFEAGFRRRPTFVQFIRAFDEGVAELREAFPSCTVVTYSGTMYKAAYAQLEAFDQRYDREVAFLQEVCPYVAGRVSRKSSVLLAKTIVHAADKYKLQRASLVCVAVLSCLYKDVPGEPPAIGRKVIKPKEVYSESDAYNALSDFRNIEMMIAGQALFKRGGFSLCTCDRPLALFWSVFSPIRKTMASDEVEMTAYLTTAIFSRLAKDELNDLKQLLSS